MCGTGLGMSYAANRHPHVRAAVAWAPEIAALARQHNDANVLVLPARFVGDDEAERILDAWLATPFEGGRHERRIEKIETDGRGARRRGGAPSPRPPGRHDDRAPAVTRTRSSSDELARLGSLPAGPRPLRDGPRDRAPDRARDRTAERGAGADRERELRVAGGAGGDGLPAHEQVRRGAARKALLRRLRDRRPGRAAGDRPREAALRRRARERAAALGRVRQRGGVPRPSSSRATPSSAWTCRRAGTSRTARR
jgi:hypothetical protein